MIVVKQPDKKIMSDLGYQTRTKGKTYRMLKYCEVIDYDNGKLIYNNLSKSLVWMKEMEYKTIYQDEPYDYLDFLVRNYFIVPEEYDEFLVVDDLRKKYRGIIDMNYLDHPSEFTILPTTTCNARCFYCYESPMKKTPMRMETAEKVVKYIAEVSPKKDIKLRWFGGEPLFNSKVIDLICFKLRALGFTFESSMISNGYLFDEKMVTKAKEEWNLKSVLITIDGTEEVYNKTKAYIYKDTNAYQIIIDNINRLLDNNILVSIRMNVDLHNGDDLKKAVIDLEEKVGHKKGFGMYVYPLFELNGFTRTEEHKAKTFEKITEIEQVMREHNYAGSKGLDSLIKATHCMVDSGNSVLIAPDGSLGLCEHFIDTDFYSHIDHPYEKNWDIIKSWRDYQTHDAEICRSCPILPSCLKMRKCPDEKICDKYEKKLKMDHLHNAMITFYDNWKNRKNQPSCNQCRNMIQVFGPKKEEPKKEEPKKSFFKRLFS